MLHAIFYVALVVAGAAAVVLLRMSGCDRRWRGCAILLAVAVVAL